MSKKATISKMDIVNIGKLITQSYPYSECKQLNTFALVDSADDLELPNLGKTYQDFLANSFWARKWVLEGADPNTLNKQYPILALEQKVIKKKDIFAKEGCYTFWFTVMDVPDCPTCKDACKRSVDQVDCDIQEIALSIQQELKNYGLFEVAFTDQEEPVFLWVSSGQIVQWETDLAIDYYEPIGDLCDFITSEAVEIFPTEVGTADGARAVTFSFQICTCAETSNNFDFTRIEPKQIAVAQCPTC